MFSLAPAASVQACENHWSDNIDTMVSSGDFIEGEVVVALWGSEEGVLQAQASLPGDAFEPLMEVGSAALSGEAADGMIAQAAEDVTLTLVRSDTLSTKELLQSLADDERVAFAEPNYLGYGTDDDPVAAVDDVLATEDSFGTSTSVIPDELDLEGVLPTLANEDEQPSGMADS